MNLIDEEQKKKIDEIESSNRKSRRGTAKYMKKDMKLSFLPKIPGTQRPFVKEFATWTPYGDCPTEKSS